jgi:8-oxo-dGTP pyrophosphatase MutT (NUDIX family)
MIHHAKLKKWLQPGGHSDGNENVLNVARKEVTEETSLENLKLLNSLFDIDIHSIPARNDFPQHLHYDVRFAFEVSDQVEYVANIESVEIGWKNLHSLDKLLEPGSSIRRMVAKTYVLSRADKH